MLFAQPQNRLFLGAIVPKACQGLPNPDSSSVLGVDGLRPTRDVDIQSCLTTLSFRLAALSLAPYAGSPFAPANAPASRWLREQFRRNDNAPALANDSVVRHHPSWQGGRMAAIKQRNPASSPFVAFCHSAPFSSSELTDYCISLRIRTGCRCSYLACFLQCHQPSWIPNHLSRLGCYCALWRRVLFTAIPSLPV